MRLRLAGRQEDLIAPGSQCIQQRLTGKEERCPDLARFEDIADTVLQPGTIPPHLVIEGGFHKDAAEFLNGRLAEQVTFYGLAFPLVTVGDVRV
ncbi:hypothetical protein D3C80_1783880 [compost metagenome]